MFHSNLALLSHENLCISERVQATFSPNQSIKMLIFLMNQTEISQEQVIAQIQSLLMGQAFRFILLITTTELGNLKSQYYNEDGWEKHAYLNFCAK